MSLVSLLLLTFAGIPENTLLPRELAPGVFVLGSSQTYHSANVGWVVLADRTILVGLPDPKRIDRVLEEARRTSSKPIQSAIVLQARSDDIESALLMARRGVDILADRDASAVLHAAIERAAAADSKAWHSHIREFAEQIEIGDAHQHIKVMAQRNVAGPGLAVAYLSRPKILFAGALCVHGPRAELSGTDTLQWIFAIERLQAISCLSVVPGRGTIGDASLLERERRFLRELRRQVGHLVAQARSLEHIANDVKLTPEYLVWMPYDQPVRADIEHVYRERTVPLAPFGDPKTLAAESRPKALVLIGDYPHDPGHIEDGLRRALEGAGIAPYIAVDVRALSAENLKRVQLFVILRDGAVWPNGRDKPSVSWMTHEQQQAVVDFVERGGGLLALHNSTGLYPDGGPYLKLVGGTYEGHGPLERFRVSALDRAHPITRGVTNFEVADEQHTPMADKNRVHLLLESRSDEGTTGAAGWVRQVGRGRMCYLANGHTRDAQNHPEFQKLLRNAAIWCIGADQNQP